MILVDTSIWIDHLSAVNPDLHRMLAERSVLMHPFVIGELACGNLRNRAAVLELMGNLPQAVVADHDEVLALIERNALAGIGIGWVDAHLLAAVLLMPGTQLWSRDKRLKRTAQALNCRFGGASGQSR